MRALLDTHAFIWMANSPEKLSSNARRICEEESLVLSVARVWEMTVRARPGKLIVVTPVGEYIRRQTRIGSIALLPIQFHHAVRAGELDSGHIRSVRSDAGRTIS